MFLRINRVSHMEADPSWWEKLLRNRILWFWNNNKLRIILIKTKIFGSSGQRSKTVRQTRAKPPKAFHWNTSEIHRETVDIPSGEEDTSLLSASEIFKEETRIMVSIRLPQVGKFQEYKVRDHYASWSDSLSLWFATQGWSILFYLLSMILGINGVTPGIRLLITEKYPLCEHLSQDRV